MKKAQIEYVIHFLILGLFAYFSIFKGLCDSPIHMWDEATYANNAIDMAYEDQSIWLVTHMGEVDNYNTKPPFVIWMQAICMNIFGVNELAVRLPSAMSGLLMVFLIYVFCARNLNHWIGFLAGSILLCSQGYISEHVVRSGDLDAILTFWIISGFLVFLDLTMQRPKKSLFHFILIGLSILLAFLSKGIAGFFLIPYMVLIAFFHRNRFVLKDIRLYTVAFLTLLASVSYYGLREFISPGHIEIVVNSEFMRYGKAIMSWHVHPFDYYFENLKNDRFSSFFYFLPFVLITPFIPENKTEQNRTENTFQLHW